MALEQYAVRLTPDERERLSQLIRSGKSSARIVARARILLKVDEGWTGTQLASPQTPARWLRLIPPISRRRSEPVRCTGHRV